MNSLSSRVNIYFSLKSNCLMFFFQFGIPFIKVLQKHTNSRYPKLHRLETPWESDCLIVVFFDDAILFCAGKF